MDACSDYIIKEVVVMAGAQLGKSEALLNIIGYHIDHDPCPILMLQPTESMAQSFSKDRIANVCAGGGGGAGGGAGNASALPSREGAVALGVPTLLSWSLSVWISCLSDWIPPC